MRTLNARLLALMITGAAIAAAFWATEIHDASLRNPRFLDGWVLVSAMALQLLLHFFRKRWLPQPGNEDAWITFHIYTGLFVTSLFALHTTFALPDTLFEWALWACFALVIASGILGTYITRVIPYRLEDRGERFPLEVIPALRSEIAERASAITYQSGQQAGSSAVLDIYADTLHSFFRRPRNIWLHLRRSPRPMKQLMFQLETAEADLDRQALPFLQELKTLVEQKDRLDFHYAHEVTLRIWLFVHVPATYGLLVLSVVHVLSIYAFRSGVE